MNKEKPANQFQEVHKQVKERLEQARQVQEKDAEARRQRAKEEAIREGFDRA